MFNSSYFFHKVAKHMFFERHATHDEGALKPPNLELLGFKIFIASVSSSIICFYWKRSILIKCRKRSRKKNRYIDEKKVGQQFFLSNPKTAGWNWCNNGDDAICCTVRYFFFEQLFLLCSRNYDGANKNFPTAFSTAFCGEEGIG